MIIAKTDPKEFFHQEDMIMGHLKNMMGHLYCAWCAGLVESTSVSTGLDENDVVPREEGSRTRQLWPDHEEYLQIPTFLRLGRRLS